MLGFRDLNDEEQTAPRPAQTVARGRARQPRPAAGEVGYGSPGGDLDLYCRDVRIWNGIVPIDQIDSGKLDSLARQHDNFRATIERETR